MNFNFQLYQVKKSKNGKKCIFRPVNKLRSTLLLFEIYTVFVFFKFSRLFDEMCTSLEASTEGDSQCPSKRYMNMSREALAEAIKATPLITPVTPENETNEIIASLYRQFEELHSPTSKPFSVIVHGDIRPENVTFIPGDVPGDEPKEAKLCGLFSAVVGSPLLDIYAVVFNCANPDARSLELEFLTTYFDAFVEVSNHLRMKVNDFTLNNLVS